MKHPIGVISLPNRLSFYIPETKKKTDDGIIIY
jgi:hypothetical protein